MTQRKQNRKIRVALLRCDTHGYYYGALMAPCDPRLLAKYNKIVHYYATNWYDASQVTLPTTFDFEFVKCWDRDFRKAQQFSATFRGTARPCRKLAELTTGIDAAFICDCDGSGVDHLELATPFLEAGIPTFVDKPFAATLADARAIVGLARRHRAPLYSASILSEVVAADTFRARFAEIGAEGADWRALSQAAVALGCDPRAVPGVRVGVVKGVGGALSQENLGQRAGQDDLESRLAYIIHGVSLALNVFGNKVDWVEAMGAAPLEYLHLHLQNGRDVMVLNPSVEAFPERCSFYVEAYSKLGAIHSGPIGDPEFLRGADRIVRKFRGMVRTGKWPVAAAELLAPIAVIDAARRAQQDGRKIQII